MSEEQLQVKKSQEPLQRSTLSTRNNANKMSIRDLNSTMAADLSIYLLSYNFSESVRTQYGRDEPYGAPYLQIFLKDMISYELTYNINESMHYNLPLKSPAIPDYIEVQDPTSPLFTDKLWGIALDGIPIYSSLHGEGDDIFYDTGTDAYPYKFDLCGGTYGPISADNREIRYHYRFMPTCILTSEDNSMKRQQYIIDPYQLLDAFTSFDGASILGYSLAGYPIYSPYDSRGVLQDGLDNCNGKYVNGTYGYYVTPKFPYIIGCDGPGVYDYLEVGVPPEYLSSVVKGAILTPCPGGYYPTPEGSGSTGCIACPAGRYSSTSYAFIKSNEDVMSLVCASICPEGSYCPKGSVKPLDCPGGRYGASTGLGSSDCSGLCFAGHFCPPRSISPMQYPCGNESFYCPSGSSQRSSVALGFYSLPEDVLANRISQLPCNSGMYCTEGVRYSCPAGRYGNTSNLMDSNCTDHCPRGSYCPEMSVSPIPCPPGSYGGETGLMNNTCSGLCLKGHYCELGSTNRTQNICAGGRYGSEDGLTTSECRPVCEETEDRVQYCKVRSCAAGYYCPPGSTVANQNQCGSANLYCPEGVAYPLTVAVGFYSLGPLSSLGVTQNISDINVRTAQQQCEPGHFCDLGVRYPCPSGTYSNAYGTSSSSCVGQCDAGFYCESASSSSTQHSCGNSSVYCAVGSSAPTAVLPGYYSVNGSVSTRSARIQCPPGSYCVGGVIRPCPAGRYSLGSGSTTASCDGLCSAGSYCPLGSAFMTSCPSGTYGFSGSVSAVCTGVCSPGYYCTTGSSSATENECGGEYVYCPLNSSLPVNVSISYFSVGGSTTTRTGQTLCVSTRSSPCPSTTRLV